MRPTNPSPAYSNAHAPSRQAAADAVSAVPISPGGTPGWIPLFNRMLLPVSLFALSLSGILPGAATANPGNAVQSQQHPAPHAPALFPAAPGANR